MNCACADKKLTDRIPATILCTVVKTKYCVVLEISFKLVFTALRNRKGYTSSRCAVLDFIIRRSVKDPGNVLNWFTTNELHNENLQFRVQPIGSEKQV